MASKCFKEYNIVLFNYFGHYITCNKSKDETYAAAYIKKASRFRVAGVPVFCEDSGAVLQPVELARANWELDIILFFDGSQHFEIPIRLRIWRSRRPH